MERFKTCWGGMAMDMGGLGGTRTYMCGALCVERHLPVAPCRMEALGAAHSCRPLVGFLVRFRVRRAEPGGLQRIRLDFEMDTSLLNAAAVMNEADLWHTWVPLYRFPIRGGIRNCVKLAQLTRASQLLHLQVTAFCNPGPGPGCLH